jgi:hypothetical protein
MGSGPRPARIRMLACALAAGAFALFTTPLLIHEYCLFAEYLRTRPDPQLGTPDEQAAVLRALLDDPPVASVRLSTPLDGVSIVGYPPRMRLLLDRTVAFCRAKPESTECPPLAEQDVMDVRLDERFDRKLRRELIEANRASVPVDVPAGTAFASASLTDIVPLLDRLGPDVTADQCTGTSFPDSFDASQVSRAVFAENGHYALVYVYTRTCDLTFDVATLHSFRRQGVRWENAGRVRLGQDTRRTVGFP